MFRFDPKRSMTRSCRARSSLACVDSGMLSISSRNSVPPLACSILPTRAFARARKSARLVSEELALDHRLRHGGAIDRDIVRFVPAAEIMDAARYEILADTGLAIKDDADVGAGKLGDRGAQLLGRLRRADDAGAQRLLADDAPQAAILDDELALLAGSPHDLEKALGRERLLDEVVGAEIASPRPRSRRRRVR